MASEDIAGQYYGYAKQVDPTPGSVAPIGTTANPQRGAIYLWVPGDLAYRVATPADFSGGGGGGGAVTVADGADVTQGAKADEAWDGAYATPSVVSILKSLGVTLADAVATEATLAAVLARLIAAPATEARQATGNTSIASVDTKTPALGQALAVASTPVVLTALQLAALTPPAAITNYAAETGGNLASIKAKTDNIDVLLSSRTKPSDQQHVIIDSSASIAVTGPLTDTQLRAIPVPVSGTVTEASAAAILLAVDGVEALLGAQARLVDTQPVSNASLVTIAAAVKAEDSVSADLDTGVPALTVRADAPVLPASSLNGDYQFLTTDSLGRLWTNTDALAEGARRSNDLLLTRNRLAADHLRFQGMMAGAFIPIPEVF